MDIVLIRFPTITKNDGLDKLVLVHAKALNVTEFQVPPDILVTPRKCFVSEIVITEDRWETSP